MAEVRTVKNSIVFAMYALVMGAFIGALVWAFLALASYLSGLIWKTIPDAMSFPLYPVAVCLIGGAVIGLAHKKFGDYPEDMETIMARVKAKNGYYYGNLPMIALMALLPIVFGASIGPEAGLTGFIVGLCYFAGDHFKYARKNVSELAEIGISATVGAIFRVPLFGLMLPIENRANEAKAMVFPKSGRIFVTVMAILGALGIYRLLGSLLGGGLIMPSFPAAGAFKPEFIWQAIAAAAAGTAGAALFTLSKKAVKKALSPLKKLTVTKCIAGGAVLAICGMAVPFAMFSGEEQSTELMNGFASYSGWALLGIGAVKLCLTNVCIETGWRGGHFFPMIFGGVSIGYGMAALLGAEPVICVFAATAALLGAVMRKPVAAALLLMLCFPLSSVVYVLPAAFLGSLVPVSFNKI